MSILPHVLVDAARTRSACPAAQLVALPHPLRTVTTMNDSVPTYLSPALAAVVEALLIDPAVPPGTPASAPFTLIKPAVERPAATAAG